MYADRIDLYEELEQKRESRVLVYVTGDRPGLETQIHPEVLDFFVEHLDDIGDTEKVTLFLYTRGGSTLAGWSIVNLIRQFCNRFEVIVPVKAHSSGTLIALGADTIVMTKQATLGPIDPSVNTPLNPQVPGAPPNSRVPVSVEAINGFMALASEMGVTESGDLAQVLSDLTQHVHPLVLGNVYRSRTQIRMLGERLLLKHMTDQDDKIERILDFLTSESGSHDYTIYRQEARDDLGLNVERPDDDLYRVIKGIYSDIAQELALTVPYALDVLLGTQTTATYELVRGLIESVEEGSHRFVSRGQLVKQQIQIQPGVLQEGIQDNRTFEGWTHDATHARQRS